MPKDISSLISYFPEFIKIEGLSSFKVEGVALGHSAIHTLCKHKETGKSHVLGWGANHCRQLLHPEINLIQQEPLDITSHFLEHS